MKACDIERCITEAAAKMAAKDPTGAAVALAKAEELAAPSSVLASTIRAHRQVLATKGAEYDLPAKELAILTTVVARMLQAPEPRERKTCAERKAEAEAKMTPEQKAEADKRRAAWAKMSPDERRAAAKAKFEEFTKARNASRQPVPQVIEVQEAVTEPDTSGKPLLVLLTALSSLDVTYSLATVIRDQALAGVAAGFSVELVGMKGLAGGIPGVKIVPLLPGVIWNEDEVSEEKAAKLEEAIRGHLAGREGVVIVHDLLLQTWYLSAAMALHRIGDSLPGIRWYHQIHSAVASRPVPAVARYRARLPKGHRLASINWSDVDRLAKYYQTTPDQIMVLPNIRAAQSFLGLSDRAMAIAQAADLERADVVQIYPLSTPRAKAKGVRQVMEVFAELKHGYNLQVRLVLANAHPNGNRKMIEALQEEAAELDLKDEFFIASEMVPTKGQGLPEDDIRGLFSLSNVFCFPSVSEACGLVMLEAALSGAILVLNDDLAAVKDYIPPQAAIWVPWGSLQHQRLPVALAEATKQAAHGIIYELARRTNQAKRRVLAHGIPYLAGVLKGLAGQVGPGTMGEER